MELTNQNYFSQEANQKYMSASQFKDFLKCPSYAIAKIKGEWVEEKSTSLLIGSYIDSYYEGTLDKFKEENPNIYKKDNTLKAEYKKADEIIERLKKDLFFSKYMSGKKQVIMTGTIENVPFKIKIDSFHENKCIVDLKIVKDMMPIWINNEKKNFVEAWGYDIQMAIYQEIVFQNTGNRLPTILCVGTKETVTDLALLQIDQERLDYVMEYIIKPNLSLFQNIKQQNQTTEKCGKCDYCKSIKKIDAIINYKDIDF